MRKEEVARLDDLIGEGALSQMVVLLTTSLTRDERLLPQRQMCSNTFPLSERIALRCEENLENLSFPVSHIYIFSLYKKTNCSSSF